MSQASGQSTTHTRQYLSYQIDL